MLDYYGLTFRLPEIVMLGAASQRVRLDILCGLIWVESRADYFAIRHEEGFYRRYLAQKARKDLQGHVPDKIPTLSTEKRLRAMSLGLCQVMGETARGLGFAEDNLLMLVMPQNSVNYGALYLRKMLDQFANGGDSNEAYAIALWKYNAGPASTEMNDYPAKVLSAIENGACERILRR